MAPEDNIDSQEKMGWKTGKQQYPPPVGIPEYVKRALPPRPDSASSSIYSFPNDSPRGLSISKCLHKGNHIDSSSEGILDGAGFAEVNSPQLTTSPSPYSHNTPEIAAPQPRYPARMILETTETDNTVVSPVSNPLTGNNSLRQYEVSPVSPYESSSLHSECSSRESPYSSSVEEIYIGQQPFLYDNQPIMYPSSDLLPTPGMDAANLSHQFQHQQTNLRYSDPGSPISGTVIHPPTSFPSDPNLRYSRDLGDNQRRPLTDNTKPSSYAVLGNDPSNVSKIPFETVASPKVVFAGSMDGFSARPRANSKRTAPAPPPLKLSERPIADYYVKTPFPGMEPMHIESMQEQISSVSPQKKPIEATDQKGKEEHNTITRKLNRVSTLPALVFPKSLRQNGSGGKEREKSKDKETEKGAPGLKVKSILSRAKSLRIGRGLGLGMGSDETRKEKRREEKRREEMKKQIRIGDPQL
ncbi:hypothetical protein F5Y11DRAFT_179563 [Daldinia sp. FL1419]|nr:hypothetical protein F5Y11DRAFT_179563 [Daldinia sp. FL1419]